MGTEYALMTFPINLARAPWIGEDGSMYVNKTLPWFDRQWNGCCAPFFFFFLVCAYAAPAVATAVAVVVAQAQVVVNFARRKEDWNTKVKRTVVAGSAPADLLQNLVHPLIDSYY